MADKEKVEDTSQDTLQSQDVEATEDTTSQDVEATEDTKAVHPHKLERDIANRDKRIAELEQQIKQVQDSNQTRERREKEMEDQIKALTERLENEKIESKLSSAGCLDNKAAKARLEDFGGDVGRLKEQCPYLFEQQRPQGQTGMKPKAAINEDDALREKAYKAAGLIYQKTN